MPPELADARKLGSIWRTNMKLSSKQPTYANMRLIAAAALAATLTFAPGAVFAATPASASGTVHAASEAHQDRTEQRIANMHAKLKITAAQEDQWAKVAQIMRENAKTMDTLIQARADHAKDMTAVDNLKSYGDITDAHADGIKKLTPAFAALYSSMSDSQKKDADTLFRHRDHKRGHKMSKAK
jgi:protein CpxP